MLLASGAAAQQPSRAPAGSKDAGIKAAGYCVGEALARGGRFKAGLVANSQAVKELRDAKGADAKSDPRLGHLETSGLYLGMKTTFLSSEMEWHYKMAGALGASVENPDPKVLNEGVERGKNDGEALYAVENRCERECGTVRNADELASCVDACALREKPAIFNAAKECDKLYANGRRRG